MMVKFWAALIGVLLLCDMAHADWKIEASEDQSSGRDTKRASVVAASGDSSLQLACVNGAQLLSLDVSRDLPRGMVDSALTLDDRKPRSELLQVFSDPRNVPLFEITTTELMRAKRLRVELRPIEGEPMVYDYDVSGAKKAFKAVVCGARPKSFFRRRVF